MLTSDYIIIELDGTVRAKWFTSPNDTECIGLAHTRAASLSAVGNHSTVYVKRITTELTDYPVRGMALPKSTITHSITAYVDGQVCYSYGNDEK